MAGSNAEPTEVFERMSHSTRVEILRVLANKYSDSPTDPWVDYSDLRDDVGIRDNGNFNYHLDQLDDLVVKRSAGYRISRLGMELLSTMSSGVFDTDWTWGPVDAPGGCFTCGESLFLHYEDGILHLTCGTDEHALALSIPPSLLDSYPADDVVERIAFMESQWATLTHEGICAECHGHVDGQVELAGGDSSHYDYHGQCERCGFHHGLPVGMVLMGHPAVIGFYDEHDVDVRSIPFWTLDFCEPGHEDVLSTDPLHVRVDVEHGREMLSLTLDRDGSVVSTERREGATDKRGSDRSG